MLRLFTISALIVMCLSTAAYSQSTSREGMSDLLNPGFNSVTNSSGDHFAINRLIAEIPLEYPDLYDMDFAVQFALVNNHKLNQLREEIEAAYASERYASLIYYPSLQLSATASSSGPAQSFEITGPDGMPISQEISTTDIISQGSLTLNQPVYLFGAGSLARRGASLELQNSLLAYERAVETITNEVETAFLNAALTKALVGVSEQAVSTAEERLRIANVRYDTGDVAYFEVLRAEVSLATSQEELLQAQTNAELALSSLSQKMGRDMSADMEIVPPDPDSVEPVEIDISLDEAIDKALENRKDLQILENAISLAEIGKLSLRNRPTLALSGNYAYQDTVTGFGDKDSWRVLLNLSYTLFDSGRSSAQMDSAESQKNALEEQLEETKSVVALQVENAYLKYNEAIERITVSGRTVDSAAEALRIAELGYREGVITYLDYQDSDLQHRKAETLYLQAVYSWLIADSNLKATLGVNEGTQRAIIFSD